MFDFNNAEPMRAGSFDLIPEGAIVHVVTNLRPGKAGPEGWLKENRDQTCLMADLEFVIDGGDFDRRKVWGLWITEGQTEGQQKAANITKSRLRALLESAHGIDPRDGSPEAVAKRQVKSWGDFDGLKFCAKVLIEKSKDPQYADKNVLVPVTPDASDYVAVGKQTGGAKPVGATAPIKTVASGGKPGWAQ